jgi:LysM domain
MNSIRPLVTITILTIVAVFLFMKINQAPLRPVADIGADAATQTAAGVPPLSGVGANSETAANGRAAAADSAAPVWPGVPGAADSTATSVDAAGVNVPSMPAIPELPDLAPLPDATSASAAPPVQLPANIPVARYPGDAVALDTGASAVTPQASDANTAALPYYPTTADANAPATDSAMAAVGLTPSTTYPPAAAPATTAAEAERTQPAGPGNTTGAVPSDVTPTATMPGGTPVEASFPESWPQIQAALERGELARAHQLLSQWYGEPSLTAAEKVQIDTLLGQLAGTVVYSTQHQLEPAYVVQAGDTLETIAAKYNVPWQLLAKINGVASADAVQPGQQLKVMRGPFSAVVDLSASELALMLDGRYAGRFAVSAPAGASANEGEWVVAQTFDVPTNGVVQRSLVLQRPSSTTAGAQAGILLGAAPVEHMKQLGVGIEDPVVGLSPADAAEVADILSIGSRVVIRR